MERLDRLSRLGARLGNWNDRHSSHDRSVDASFRWRFLDALAGTLFVLPDGPSTGWILRRWLDVLPHDTLIIGGRPYMRRWYLAGYAPEVNDPNLSTPGATRAGWWWEDHGLGSVRLHEIVASDDSRAYHDHPWPFLSILLRGSYVEETPDGPDSVTAWFETDGTGGVNRTWPPPGRADAFRRRFSAPAVNRKRADDLHVLDVERGPVWTLFFTRPKQRHWGFAGPFGWLPWREFDEQFPERDAWTDATSPT